MPNKIEKGCLAMVIAGGPEDIGKTGTVGNFIGSDHA